jgi:hypothetical protein
VTDGALVGCDQPLVAIDAVARAILPPADDYADLPCDEPRSVLMRLLWIAVHVLRKCREDVSDADWNLHQWMNMMP